MIKWAQQSNLGYWVGTADKGSNFIIVNTHNWFVLELVGKRETSYGNSTSNWSELYNIGRYNSLKAAKAAAELLI